MPRGRVVRVREPLAADALLWSGFGRRFRAQATEGLLARRIP